MTAVEKAKILNKELAEILKSLAVNWENVTAVRELTQAFKSKYNSSKEAMIKKYKKSR